MSIAPTDESVKLLREMEAAAKEQVTEAIHVHDVEFDCVVHSQKECLSDSIRMAAVFSLNGKKHRVEVEEHAFKAKEIPSRLCDAVAREIAETVLIPAFQRASLF